MKPFLAKSPQHSNKVSLFMEVEQRNIIKSFMEECMNVMEIIGSRR
jgi:hypothetical protein